MKTNIKKLSLVFVILLFFVLFYPAKINAVTNDYSLINDTENLTPSQISSYKSYDYVIDKYDVNIDVKENNTFYITETISAYFNSPKHGIIRNIPLKNTVKRLDGTTSTNHAKIRNISVDEDYTRTNEDGVCKLKIGSADYTVTGKQDYKISYTYKLGEDPSKDYDELYFNIIGDQWDTVIGNITFSITMPKEFDASKLGFSAGAYGTINSKNVTYTVNGNTITGSYNGILNKKNALTVRCELPEGYFTKPTLLEIIMENLIYVIPVIFLIISILIWHKYGRDDKVVETVEFYPPEGLNSLDVGFLYKGKAENKDVTSLLIYLANKGYLEIIDPKTQVDGESYSKLYKHSKFIIRKLKPYDGNDENEKTFLHGLFWASNEVSDKMLYNEFYVTNSRILSNVNSSQNKEEVFEKTSLNKKFIIVIMMILTFILITVPCMMDSGTTEDLMIALLFPGIGFSVLFYLLLGGKNISEKIFGLVWGLGFGGMPCVSMVLPALLQSTTYFVGYIIGIVCIIGMIECLIYLPKRTKYGTEMLGKIRGFRNFLMTAQKDRLEAMVMENPNYFYDILPYTYVLGVSDKWIKKFETISLKEPDWYCSPDAFDVVTFGTAMNRTISSAQSAMTSSPPSSDSSSSSGGGGFSGGGFSGGGSGGGGGSSW